MSFGKFKDKPVAWVLLRHPDYFAWMRKNNMVNKKEYQFMLKLMKKLNAKPFNFVKCSGSCKGTNTPTRLSLYKAQG